MAETLLEIHDLHAGAADREILKGIGRGCRQGNFKRYRSYHSKRGSTCHLRSQRLGKVYPDERDYGTSGLSGDGRQPDV